VIGESTKRHEAHEVLRGTLDLLVLRVLSLAPLHSWGIGQELRRLSGGSLCISQGTLHPALRRLEVKGCLIADWQITEHRRQARYYRLSTVGKRALDAELAEWRSYVAVVERVLNTYQMR